MNPDVAFPVWSGERAQRAAVVLDCCLAPAERPPALHEAMRYAVLGGGKRVRALMAYAAGELAGADPEVVDAAAAAVELIHAYSLVHDDLPCMDDDVLRRGRPTCHVAFGEAMALLAGDALQSLAFEVLAGGRSHDAPAQLALLAQAAGARGMAGGQALDLESTGTTLALSDLERMHQLKTGALIRAAIRLGAACGRPMSVDENAALDRCAAAMGLAFQVVDDILDVEGDARNLGKSAGKDAAQRKSTYVSLLGVSAARERVEQLRTQARAELARFGISARRLGEIADWLTTRSS